MLKQRVFTALALLAPVLAVIYFASTEVVYVCAAAAGLLMAWEWTTLMSVRRSGVRVAYLLVTALAMGLVWLFKEQARWIFTVSLVWWCLAFFLLLGFPDNLQNRKPNAVLLGVLGQILIPPTILALAYLHREGVWVLFFALVLVWAADIGAYFAGRGFGRHKLAPNISPGKTWEGAAGGLLLSALWVVGVGPYVFDLNRDWMLALLALSLVVAIFSIIGDLTESLFKRLSGVKDSGAILPGHGGVLDRVDSLLAALPIFSLGLIAGGGFSHA